MEQRDGGKNKFMDWCLQHTASCSNYSKSYVCPLSAKKKIQSVLVQEYLYELRVLVASATFNLGLGAFFLSSSL